MKNIIFVSLSILLITQLNAQHLVILKSGEKINGEVKSIDDGKLTFIFKGNPMTLNISEIESIRFGDNSADEATSNMEAVSGMKGVSFVLPGRKIAKPPVFENLTMKKGIVVVAISVDKYGHVYKSEPGAEGTTTTDSYLLTLGKKAAESALFDNCPKCPLEMKGTMTIMF